MYLISLQKSIAQKGGYIWILQWIEQKGGRPWYVLSVLTLFSMVWTKSLWSTYMQSTCQRSSFVVKAFLSRVCPSLWSNATKFWVEPSCVCGPCESLIQICLYLESHMKYVRLKGNITIMNIKTCLFQWPIYVSFTVINLIFELCKLTIL